MKKASRLIELAFVLRQHGLGGDNSWGAKPHAPYRIQPQPMAYSYRLKLVNKGDDLARTARGASSE